MRLLTLYFQIPLFGAICMKYVNQRKKNQQKLGGFHISFSVSNFERRGPHGKQRYADQPVLSALYGRNNNPWTRRSL